MDNFYNIINTDNQLENNDNPVEANYSFQNGAFTIRIPNQTGFISPFNKVVITDNNINVIDSLQYYLQLKGIETLQAYNGLTNDDKRSIITRAILLISMNQILLPFVRSSALQPNGNFRAIDTHTLAVTESANRRALTIAALDKAVSEAYSDTMSKTIKYMKLAFIVCGVSRKLYGGHTYGFTAQDTQIFKICVGESTQFKSWCDNYAHDMMHFLEDTFLDRICLGSTSDRNFVLLHQISVNNSLVAAGQNIFALVRLPTVACLRYPPSVPGYSSVILTIQIWKTIISDISSRYIMTGAQYVIRLMGITESHLEQSCKRMTDEQLRQIRTRMIPLTAFASGYMHEKNQDFTEQHKSLRQYENADLQKYNAGQSLWKFLKPRQSRETAQVNIMGQTIRELMNAFSLISLMTLGDVVPDPQAQTVLALVNEHFGINPQPEEELNHA